MNVRTTPLWIAGESKESESGEYFDVLNPLDDSLYARAAKATAGDIDRAVTAADESFQTYRRSLPKEREAWLIRAADLLQQQASDFIEILIDEVGSPLAKAQREVASSVGLLRAAAGACRQLSGKTMPTDIAGRMSISIREPLGVVAGITPFNVPLIKGIKHSAMPLATGNTLVMLPSEHAPVTAYRIAQLYADAGIPKGAVNIVSGDGYEIGDRLTTHPLVQAVGFTGSCRVGKHVSRLCGEHGKRLTLEMGGKNPLVILRDADLQRAVAASVLGSFFYQGQICMSSSRIYVQQDIYEEYLTKFVAAAKNLAMGDLRDKNTMIGPIISHRQRERVKQHIENAKACGAKLQTGGEWSGNRCQPTVFSDVPANAILTTEETFGPVTAVYSVDSFDDALQQVNGSPFGLSASIFTSDMGSAMKFVEQANAGMVHVNGATVQEEAHVPFGGNGSSGFGRESTDADIQELTRWKWATLQG